MIERSDAYLTGKNSERSNHFGHALVTIAVGGAATAVSVYISPDATPYTAVVFSLITVCQGMMALDARGSRRG